MKNLIAISIAMSLLSLAIFAGCAKAETQVQACNTPQFNMEKQGCCSRHKGVCGCRGGVVVCCDGSTSPTCGCF